MSARDDAKKDWENGAKYKDIAQKYNVSVSTVKSWANRYWKSDRVATGQNKVAKKIRKVAENATKEKTASEIAAEAMADAVYDNNELNEAQKEFCLYYMQTKNAIQSYIKVYHCSYTSAMSNSSRLLNKPKIKEELERLREIKKTAISYMTADDVVDMYMKIAFADITDFVEFNAKDVPYVSNTGKLAEYIDEKTGKKKFLSKHENQVFVKPSAEIDGQLISEITTEKGKVKIKLADKMKALQFLERYFELNPNDRNKNEYSKAMLEIERQKLELIKENNSEIEDTSETDEVIYGENSLQTEENDTV